MIRKIWQKLFFYFFSSNLGEHLFLKVGQNLFSLPRVSNIPRLARIYNKLLLQGYLNAQVIPYNPLTVWPYWVTNFEQAKKFCLPLINTTHRNWTTLGLCYNEIKSIVDQKGMITPTQNSWSLDTWLKLDAPQRLIAPSRLKNVSQKWGDFGSLETSFLAEGIEYSATTYVNSYQNQNIIFNRVKLKNTTNSTQNFSLIFAIRPYNPEGIVPIQEVTYLTSNAFMVNNQLGLVLNQKPDNVLCLSQNDEHYNILDNINNWEMILNAKCHKNLASAMAEYKITLEKKQEKTFVCKIPVANKKASNTQRIWENLLKDQQNTLLNTNIDYIKQLNFYTEEDKLVEDWQKILAELVKIKLPDKKTQKIFEKNILHLFNFIGEKKIYSGSFTFKHFMLRDSVYMMAALNRLGGAKTAQSLLSNINSFNKGELDNFGQIIFALYDNYNFTKNLAFLEDRFKFVNICVGQIQKNLHKSGLLKKSFSCEKTGFQDNYLADNFWALAGLRTALKIAILLGKEKQIPRYTLLKATLSRNLTIFISTLFEKSKIKPFIPISPHRGLDAQLISGLASVYPLKIFEPSDPLVINTLDLIEKLHTKDGIFCQHIGESGAPPAQNARLAQIYLTKKDPKAFAILDWLNKVTTDTATWPEYLHPSTLNGISGAGHSGLASAEYLQLIRNMLIKEEKETLTITPFIPETWLNAEGQTISAQDFPTIFGLISFELKMLAHHKIVLTLNTKYDNVPKKLKIGFSKTVKTMELLEKTEHVNDTIATIPVNIKQVIFSL
jgi:hypothetical protein